MALGKQVPTAFAVDMTYWRVGVLNIHPRTRTVQVVLDGYVSEQARRAGAAPAGNHELTLPYSSELADGGRAAIYAAIKAGVPGWADAEDA